MYVYDALSCEVKLLRTIEIQNVCICFILSGRSDINHDEGDVDFCRFQYHQNYEGGCLEQRHNQLIKVDVDDSGQDGVACYKVS